MARLKTCIAGYGWALGELRNRRICGPRWPRWEWTANSTLRPRGPSPVFKSKGGGRAYFHGGLSPQELIIPVVVMHSAVKSSAPSTGIQWTLTPGTAKLTTRFFSVQIAGSQSESSLFGFEPPKVRIELRANKKCVSLPVSASYGFEDATGEVKLKIAENDNKRIEPNTVTVMLSEEISQKTVGVYLLDATTGAELAAPLTVDVAISM